MSSLAGLPTLLVLAQVLGGPSTADQEAVRFGRSANGVELSLVTTVASPPARLIALLANPGAYRRAVPAFVKADVLTEEPAKAPEKPARLLAWELEVPLWNLAGRLWLRPHPAGVDLELVEGDLAPGKLELRVEQDGGGSTLRLAGAANLKNANFMTRRLAARDREAEPAMNVTAMYVLLRALALEAARSGPVLPRRQPTAPMAARPLGAEARAFFDQLAPPQAGAQANTGWHARVTSRPTGRLDRVEIAIPLPLPAPTAATRVLEAPRWQALPGWKHIANLGGRPVRWDVDASLPFVDFDATWTLHGERPFRAEAHGDWKGATLAVDIYPAATGSLMVFTAHPRVDATGYIPRKLIEAEPLLEQGLALGLTFVDASALARALVSAAPPPRAPQLSPSGRQKIE